MRISKQKIHNILKNKRTSGYRPRNQETVSNTAYYKSVAQLRQAKSRVNQAIKDYQKVAPTIATDLKSKLNNQVGNNSFTRRERNLPANERINTTHANQVMAKSLNDTLNKVRSPEYYKQLVGQWAAREAGINLRYTKEGKQVPDLQHATAEQRADYNRLRRNNRKHPIVDTIYRTLGLIEAKYGYNHKIANSSQILSNITDMVQTDGHTLEDFRNNNDLLEDVLDI